MNGCRTVAGDADAKVTDPANGETGSGKIALGERYVRKGKLKIAGIFDLLGLKRFSIEGADCDRDFLKRLVLALGASLAVVAAPALAPEPVPGD